MNTVDWILLGALAVFAWAGWRQGFVAGVLSFAGFIGGGIAALLWLPNLIKSFVTDQSHHFGGSGLHECHSWASVVFYCWSTATGKPHMATGEIC